MVTKVEREAFKQAYEHYGKDKVLSNNIVLYNAIGDLLGSDGKKLRNHLKIALDAGINQMYQQQLDFPSNDFDARVKSVLTDAGLSDEAAANIQELYDYMVGFSSEPKPVQYQLFGGSTSEVSSVVGIEQGKRNTIGTDEKEIRQEQNQKGMSREIHQEAAQQTQKEKTGKRPWRLYETLNILVFLMFVLYTVMEDFVVLLQIALLLITIGVSTNEKENSLPIGIGSKILAWVDIWIGSAFVFVSIGEFSNVNLALWSKIAFPIFGLLLFGYGFDQKSSGKNGKITNNKKQ